ncbi:MAG TPA: hypothetical protein VN754_13730 [Candidatus Binataceae bacterium]|nr:hypothetical protein [Candidatus Binataceae bacterium]
MTYVKRIVCLANSFKIGGSCIAGREVLGKGKYGGWLRPVSSRPTAEVRVSECRYQNSAIPKLLDIIDVPLLKAVPHNHQTENHEIDAKSRWVKVGELPWDELEQLRERPASLWINSDSTSTGAFNCLSQAEAATLHDSLVLIKKKDFTVEVASNPWDGRRTYRGNFKYDGFYYSLSMTDPVATKAFAAKDEGEYELNDVYLCISLTEPYEKDGRCHKLVAAIISDPPL